MNIKDQLIQTIKDCSWSQADKDRLLGLMPGFGHETWRFLDNEVSASGSNWISKHLLAALQACAEANKGLERGDVSLWSSILEGAEDNRDLDYGRYVAFPAVDELKKISGSSSVDLRGFASSVLVLEEKHLLEFSNEEVLDLCSRWLGFMVQAFDFFEDLKKYYIERVPKQSGWLKQLSISLKGAQEIFGNNNLSLEGKNIEPKIGFWIQDFTFQAVALPSQRGVFDIIQYVNSSPNAKMLSAEEKSSLTEILKIYLWTTESLKGQARPVVALPSTAFMQPREKLVGSLPKSSVTELQTKQDSMNPQKVIDNKLVELKKKVNKNKQ